MVGKKKNGFLIGCGSIFAVIILVVLIAGVVIYAKKDSIVSYVLEQAKTGVQYLLTEDHTQEEADEFTLLFGRLVDEVKTRGFQQGVAEYEPVIRKLEEIIEDKRINRFESQEWVNEMKNSFE